MSSFPTPRVFALVNYVPGPLGAFLTDLRAELVSGYRLRSHLTVLPPRVLGTPVEQLSARLTDVASRLAPFEVELGEVEVFASTGVVYLGLASGSEPVRHLHQKLNGGALEFPEPYAFHPHVTLAQDVPADTEHLVEMLARLRWAQYDGPRSFRVESLSLVENISLGRWDTLSEHSLTALGQHA